MVWSKYGNNINSNICAGNNIAGTEREEYVKACIVYNDSVVINTGSGIYINNLFNCYINDRRNTVMNFSASDLVKKSATQIKYLRDKAISIHTWKMEHGIEYQKKIADENKGSCEEMRTTYNNDDICIFACHDIVCDDKIIEVKNTDFCKETWYFENSLLQTAFYKSLLMKSNGDLYTPRFKVKEGYNKEYKKVNPNIDYHLRFGDKEYNVIVTDADEIINYFLEKAKITMLEYDDCRAYDNEHKRKHYEDLCKYFYFEEIDEVKKENNKYMDIDLDWVNNVIECNGKVGDMLYSYNEESDEIEEWTIKNINIKIEKSQEYDVYYEIERGNEVREVNRGCIGSEYDEYACKKKALEEMIKERKDMEKVMEIMKEYSIEKKQRERRKPKRSTYTKHSQPKYYDNDYDDEVEQCWDEASGGMYFGC